MVTELSYDDLCRLGRLVVRFGNRYAAQDRRIMEWIEDRRSDVAMRDTAERLSNIPTPKNAEADQ